MKSEFCCDHKLREGGSEDARWFLPASLSFLPPSPPLPSLVTEMQLVRLTGSVAQESKSTTKAIDSITVGIAKSKKAVLLLGAGVSTRAGIPVSLIHSIQPYAYS